MFQIRKKAEFGDENIPSEKKVIMADQGVKVSIF